MDILPRMTESEPAVLDAAQAETILRVVFPAAAVTEVAARTGGRLSAVYEVRCADPAHTVIFKIYSEQWRWKQSKEVRVYELLASRTGWPVPAVLHHSPDGGPGGRAITILSLLPGRPLSEASEEVGAAQVPELYRQMGAALADVHRISQEAYGYLVTKILDPLPDNGSYMRHQFAKKLKEFEELGGDQDLHAAVTRRVERGAGFFDNCEHAVLCHNDLHEGNVLVSPGSGGWKITGLIDVENAIAADPLMDLAKTDLYSLGRGEPETKALLEGYGTLPEDAAQRLDLYRLYHAIELWDWFTSIGISEPLASIAADIARLAG